MRIAEVIGKVTLSRCHPSIENATWRLVVPLNQAGLSAHAAGKSSDSGRDEPLVALDEMSAGNGSLIALSESAEASAPFYPDQKPINAYIAAILDHVEIEESSEN